MNNSFIFDDLFLTLFTGKKRSHVNFIFRAFYTDKPSHNRPLWLIRKMIK